MVTYDIKEKLCIALDVDNIEEAIRLARVLVSSVGIFKVGKQLFTKEGPRVIKEIINIGGKVFLDLKYHDIPNTVASAAKEVVKLGVHMFNIHASGGSEMMQATVEAVNKEAQKLGTAKPLILAVTVLTSINDYMLTTELGVRRELTEHVVYLANLAKHSGINGVVASPQEIQAIRNNCGKDFIILTPGIRPLWSTKDDQKRVTTPKEAIALGADYIVVGRPILKADNPVEAANKILEDMTV
ncbi:MAG: orotidine-5'-phosphate decarboxylase [Candidatus Magnetoovum sp. WYHC-5]|nr:orotidine-5'-phosphate decarboxylase [Candidatus Magnetoovum sp. WYHC-5]